MKRIIALLTSCIVLVSSCLLWCSPVRVSAAAANPALLYDLYQLYLLLMGVCSSAGSGLGSGDSIGIGSDQGFDNYFQDYYVDKWYRTDYEENLTEHEHNMYRFFDLIHLDDLISSFDNLCASFDEVYEGGVGDVGSFIPADISYLDGLSTCNGVLSFDSSFYDKYNGSAFPSSDSPFRLEFFRFSGYNRGFSRYLIVRGNFGDIPDGMYDSSIGYAYHLIFLSPDGSLSFPSSPAYNSITFSYKSKYGDSPFLSSRSYSSIVYPYKNSLTNDGYSWSDVCDLFTAFGVPDTIFYSLEEVKNAISSGVWTSLSDSSKTETFDPVYSYPAAQDLAKENGTLSGVRLAVDTPSGVADLENVLKNTGCEDMDDVAAGVASGSIPMNEVFSAAGVTPYVLTDVETGAVVTDMNVSATAEGVKPVALTPELAIPGDIAAAPALTIPGKTYDPDISKYDFPLFNFFPFCLPWDIYRVLSSFKAEPVAPVIEIPLGKFFSGLENFGYESDYVAVVDLGDENYSFWFKILRLLESLGIIVGFVLVARKLIHGGN